MKRRAAILAAAAIAFAANAFAGFPPGEEVSVGTDLVARYDRFSNATSIYTKVKGLRSKRARLAMSVLFASHGDTISCPTTVTIEIACRGADWRFVERDARRLVFLVDGKRLDVPLDEYDPDSRGEGVLETMSGVVDVVTARTILQSAGEGSLGGLEFDFGDAAPAMAEMGALLAGMGCVSASSASAFDMGDNVIGKVLLAAFIFFAYFLPTTIAQTRKHQNLKSIFVLNLLLGWTVIGWVVALIWSVSATRPTATA